MIPIGDSHKTGKLPVVTILILFINIAVFFVELTAPDIEAFFLQYAFIPANFIPTQLSTWAPIISAAFLHGGISHILFNMLFLWVFGDNVEESLGTIRFILFYLGASIAAALLQYIIEPSSAIPMIGASGAIAGILGYYLVVFPRHTIQTLLFFAGGIFVRDLPAQIFLAYWAITQFFSGFGSLVTAQDGGTAWFAHIGGLLFGVIIGLLMKQWQTSRNYSYVSPPLPYQ
ncbi:MAG: rhomboid family intramembrane serine protease [Patescibacteria group bacterium]